jgi:hypothetical protein
MRLLVCGGRDYRDVGAVYAALDRAHAKRLIRLLIHGACPTGADKHAEDWAKARQVPYLGVPAEWKKYGKRAGPLRNARMLDDWQPDGVTAFPGGDGTADMMARARDAGVKVWEPCAES